ncbi:hypothetical protein Q5692_31275 [Microcoleus sp. C2C3]|uniref:hypothetical protein n=1 Tax=unclassified Microcoleus TaxID=2642155 RepID=UPI002FD25441
MFNRLSSFEGRGKRFEGRRHSAEGGFSHSDTLRLAHSPTLTSCFESGGGDRTIEIWVLSRY